MGAFGGGLGGNGDVCGAVIGALAVLGLRFSRATEDEKEDLTMWSFSHELVHRFTKEIMGGSMLCRDFAGVDWTNAEEVKAFYKSDRYHECSRITGETARLLGEMLDNIRK